MTASPPGWDTPTLPPPHRWYGKYWSCERYECVDLELPPHTHVSSDGFRGRDIDRVFVDWRSFAFELWTGRRWVPEGQLALDLEAQ